MSTLHIDSTYPQEPCGTLWHSYLGFTVWVEAPGLKTLRFHYYDPGRGRADGGMQSVNLPRGQRQRGGEVHPRDAILANPLKPSNPEACVGFKSSETLGSHKSTWVKGFLPVGFWVRGFLKARPEPAKPYPKSGTCAKETPEKMTQITPPNRTGDKHCPPPILKALTVYLCPNM